VEAIAEQGAITDSSGRELPALQKFGIICIEAGDMLTFEEG